MAKTKKQNQDDPNGLSELERDCLIIKQGMPTAQEEPDEVLRIRRMKVEPEPEIEPASDTNETLIEKEMTGTLSEFLINYCGVSAGVVKSKKIAIKKAIKNSTGKLSLPQHTNNPRLGQAHIFKFRELKEQWPILVKEKPYTFPELTK